MKAVNPFVRQRDFNRASRPNWQAFASHRERVAALLGEGGDSLCILGAGNCNDLDLARLNAVWRRIRLVDVDREAMQSGIERQFGSAGCAQIELQACDLTGALEYVHELAHSPSSSTAKLRNALLRVPPELAPDGRQFSMVASTCLLSQLIDIVRHAIGPFHPELQALAELVRTQHLQSMAGLVAPGGRILLLADFVSSDTLPALLAAPEDALPGTMEHALHFGHCFTGMDPRVICRALGEVRIWAEAPQLTAPWRWNLGPRTYLLTAVQCRRAVAEAEAAG